LQKNSKVPLNKKIYDLIRAEPMEISHGENYDKLYFNLNKLEFLLEILKNGCENGKEHCAEQIRLIQLSIEKRIE
jgi:hypothetical protein